MMLDASESKSALVIMCISSKLNRLAASSIPWMCRALYLPLLHDKNQQVE